MGKFGVIKDILYFCEIDEKACLDFSLLTNKLSAGGMMYGDK